MPPQPSPGVTDQISGSREQQITGYAARLDQEFPGKLTGSNGETIGQAYTSYMHSHPNASAYAVYETVYIRLIAFSKLGINLGSDLGSFLGGAGKATAELGTGAGQGLGQFTADTAGKLPSWLQGFLGNNGLVRIAEGVLGIGLLFVAADKLLTNNKLTTQIVKAATIK